MNRGVLIWLAIIAPAAVFVLFAWPTPYEYIYPRTGNLFLGSPVIRVNRMTQELSVIRAGQWAPMSDVARENHERITSATSPPF